MGFRRRSATETTATATPATVAKKSPTRTNSKYQKVGAILEKKDGGVYLKFDTEFQLDGLTFNGLPVKAIEIEDPTAKYDRMVAAGKMSEADADEKAAKVPSFVLFEVQIRTE
jgi:hypothetical protein